MSPSKKKLIEVALPIDAINQAARAEKGRKTGTVRNLHVWFAPMPSPVWRVVLAAALLDDPEDPAEREFLLRELTRLVPPDGGLPGVDAEALLGSLLTRDGHAPVPVVLDPFCGAGTTLIEAQRLGMNTVGSDLNPVPTLITRELTEFLAKVRLEARKSGDHVGEWRDRFRAAVEYWAAEVSQRAAADIAELYEWRGDGTPFAWVWAHTYPCPNPACDVEVPLHALSQVSAQPGQEAWLKHVFVDHHVRFTVVTKESDASAPTKDRAGRAQFACPACGTSFGVDYLKAHAGERKLSPMFAGIVNEGRRFYVGSADAIESFREDLVDDEPGTTPLPAGGLGLTIQPYGFRHYEELFTPRQRIALSVFASKVADLAVSGTLPGLSEAESNAVIAFLGLCVGKLSHSNSMQTRWRTRSGPSKAEAGFGQSVLTMIWDFAEVNPFGGSVGDWMQITSTALRAIDTVPEVDSTGIVLNGPAQDIVSQLPAGRYLVATDPPYFDAIGYADLSDFFYMWHRRALSTRWPELYATIGGPRGPELIADKSRHAGSEQAAMTFFIEGFRTTFSLLASVGAPDLRMLIVYAHQQKQVRSGDFSSTGWEALLQALYEANLAITASWPIHCTSSTRLRGQDSNALSTYVLLTCRLRTEPLPTVDRREFVRSLKADLPQSLAVMQTAGVAPLDLAQASIGPGMSVFTRFNSVLESDGSGMSVRTALGLIRQEVDEILDEQVADLDPVSRFCLKWFSEYGWNSAPSGTADALSRATNTSISELQRHGVLLASGGAARLSAPDDLQPGWRPELDKFLSTWEVTIQLARSVEESGLDDAVSLLRQASQRIDVQPARELAYVLYGICEKKGWSESARIFNALGTSWMTIASGAAAAAPTQSSQEQLDLGMGSLDD